MRSIAPLIAVALLAGCASIDAQRSLAQAEVSLEGARAAGAEKLAPYEYTSAEALYQKAREENGRARYNDAVDHARRAARMADQARTQATGPRPEEK